MSQPGLGQAVLDVIKDAPIAAGAGVYLLGIPVNHIFLTLTMIWAAARAIEVCLTIYWKWKDRREQGK